MISAKVVAELREKTGAGMMDCKEALKNSNGDLNKAIEHLRIKGMAAAQKRAERTTSNGVIYSYIHMEGKVGAMVEINCETDFVAKTDDFRELARDIAMQIAAMSPLYLRREDIPDEVLNKEREIYKEEAMKSGKPEKVIEKITEGKMEKYYSEVCLVDQKFIKEDKITIKDLVTQKIAKTGENIVIRRYVRYKLGEN
jgi:elongation factor Ts